VLVINSALDLYFVYQDNRRASIDVQREKAEAASQKVESFVREIEHQIGWVAYPQWAALPVEQRRFEYVRLLRQVPAITELTQLDRNGHEQLKVSRLSMDVVGSDIDRSAEPAFTEAMANKVYFGPVYFRKESEPYLSMAVAHGGRNGGVTVAEINLKLILDVIARIKIGENGYAYVVDRLGRLVAHPDISLVLRGTDMNRLAQVKAARTDNGVNDTALEAKDLGGHSVLSAHAEIPALNWLVFVELPISEALEPVINTGIRDIALLVLGLLIAGTVAALLARRMVVPIRALQLGAQRIGSGELGHRLSIKTGDELEALANQFNRSAEALEESHATLEQRVEDRTKELTESLEQQTATAEVLKVISESPTDVQPVLDAVAAAAQRFCGADNATIVLEDGTEIVAAAHAGSMPTILGRRLVFDRQTAAGRAILDRQTIHWPDIDALDPAEAGVSQTFSREMGHRGVLAAPMLREGGAIGAIMLRKSAVNGFTPRQIELAETFAAQAVIAIENVRLFTELRESLDQQTATADILRVISQSPTDVQPVLDAVVKAALRFCGARDALIALRESEDNVVTRAHAGELGSTTLGLRRDLARHTALGRAIHAGHTVHLSDIAQLDSDEARTLWTTHNVQAAMAAPMLREGVPIGAILLRKPEAGPFTPRQIELLEAFAAQAVIAIENVRLFTEIQEKSRQLELASQHKSQFLANMSHELRTPLNAILGYTEMMTDGLYGDMPEKAQTVLERVQSNGRHLLGLINDVLDLSKIEAGQLVLTIEDYSVADMVATVMSATESLARTKGIALNSAVAPGLPMGKGDARRLTQVLLNLVGNAIKFTDQGSVEIRGAAVGGNFELSVVDTGFGIAPEDQAKIFEEFQQVDNSSTRKKGGTGLGLSISRKIVELHGGAITVTSEVGKGSIFKVTIPVTATAAKDAA
jgi:signal transduction histidine kinase